MEEILMTKQDQNRQTSKTDLNLDDLESVSGGITCRKAGRDQQDYLILKLETVLVTG
jgi:hypothetical protein